MDIAQLRREYTKTRLSKKSVNQDPIEQFNLWINDAIKADCLDPTSMTISTVSKENTPSSRVVLLKGVENRQFIFYTNYNSRKGDHLSKNPNISALFFWPELERQVIIEGTVLKSSPEQSNAYFKTRPWKSRIGAIISPQSQPIESRNVIKKAFVLEAAKHIGGSIPRPGHWGGYQITPNRIEFWQGRSNRLHDRVLFNKNDDSTWDISRLAP
ncbi:MAG: pyridoxamine 5'-phosphate oxidase [Cyclobacteriaceae bacterium]|nr:pyridoxamine 5'-phosphate oxidase [Cyclobacteriaceae bacterium]MCK5278188.1 pyridoxamine 5'-phosphate oxidase [Cyclobacteriaceae bacterium]MCK5372578.1 pyridoxamine 5'-phosphate oxidase [Cyclobacteriaceae bacterium]MCK5470722.1 pyridoxamine 5'-phosphate oxidase [Cyclobacteriaceae bacterium]